MNLNKNMLNDLMESLSLISQENASGTEQGSAATEEQVASIEEVASCSEGLAKNAQEIKTLIEKFIV